ncbi:uncharacterized protein BJ212DRAFT_1279739 [Suillus subaureus]|uniref:Uncharacterized protein n=1 Tax=Suillus subaureus TaxID=48587 RepID=A0A9P7E2M0_9AGAM|nr:uncharacterized protein BJ212DRAFT_1279739 [Suillus subaureus]KAG1809400.1 hypothetical protein BJ212DRAFT_1279739 [Suillus subaureus]
MSGDQRQYSHILFLFRSLTSLTALPSFERIWAKLSRVVVKGVDSNSPEYQPYLKCLQETWVDLLNHIYTLLDVGKSVVAFIVSERMKGLK